MFRHSTNTATFFSVLMAAAHFLALSGGGCGGAETTPVWGQVRFRATPRATSTPPSDSLRSLATPRAASTPPAEPMRSFYNTTGELQHRQRSQCAL